jgi:hypothetical protein
MLFSAYFFWGRSGIFIKDSKRAETMKDTALKAKAKVNPREATARPPRAGPTMLAKPAMNWVLALARANCLFVTIRGMMAGMQG